MLRNIYLKEIKDSFRDRRTLLLTVLLPLVMMTGLTFFYESLMSDGDGDVYNLAVSEAISEEEKAILQGYENIKIILVQNPEEMVQEGEAHAALLFEEGFIEKINNGDEAGVTILGDSFSQKSSFLMNLVSSALTVLEKDVISTRLTTLGLDTQLVQPISVHYQELAEDNTSANLLAMLIPLILALAIGVGAGPAASDLFAGEKERKTMEALLMTPVKRSTLLLAKWLTISTIGALTGIITLLVVSIEIYFFTENLKQSLSGHENLLLIMGIAIVIAIVYAMLVASILMVTSIAAKTVKESQSYSSPIMMLTVFPLMIITGIGVNELAFHHFAIPILNLFSLLKELIVGVVNYEHIFITIGSNIICLAILFVVGRIMFLKDKWVMN
ncbi:ABC transporter permease [Sutcliffiella cohnii]|uniref:Sodium ABC transporter permease n=1 Tax=Sutcliffiella cohnii TaxID=33932 RepID=A0A223KL80_9BACI|nr:ABC transporter permease subunit [Sutcliffiella cohnii]AST90250.1 sodium ABC transporter permease [Sutcliffiella cohnii]